MNCSRVCITTTKAACPAIVATIVSYTNDTDSEKPDTAATTVGATTTSSGHPWSEGEISECPCVRNEYGLVHIRTIQIR